MACMSYDKLWRSEFFNKVSAEERVQDIVPNELKLEGNDNYRKDRKITINFEAVNDEDVINKTFRETSFSKVEGYISLIEKDFNEFKLRNDNQSEEVLVERAVKTTIQKVYDKGLFDELIKRIN